MSFSIKNNNITKLWNGGEILKIKNNQDFQARNIYVKYNNNMYLVWQYDITKPSINITSLLSKNGYIYLKGTWEDNDSGIKSIIVDNVEATISGNNWEVLLNRKVSELPVIVPLVATDNADNIFDIMIKIYTKNISKSVSFSIEYSGHDEHKSMSSESLYVPLSELGGEKMLSVSASGSLYNTDSGTWRMYICDSNKNRISGYSVSESNGDNSEYHPRNLKIDLTDLNDDIKKNGYLNCGLYGSDTNHDTHAHILVSFDSCYGSILTYDILPDVDFDYPTSRDELVPTIGDKNDEVRIYGTFTNYSTALKNITVNGIETNIDKENNTWEVTMYNIDYAKVIPMIAEITDVNNNIYTNTRYFMCLKRKL